MYHPAHSRVRMESAVRIMCLIGRHEYVQRSEDGETYSVCAECGKVGRSSGDPTRVPEYAMR